MFWTLHRSVQSALQSFVSHTVAKQNIAGPAIDWTNIMTKRSQAAKHLGLLIYSFRELNKYLEISVILNTKKAEGNIS